MKYRHHWITKAAALIISVVAVSSIIFVAAVAGQSTGTKPQTPPPDPYQNGTTSERATAYTQGLQSHMARRAQFIQSFQASGQDPAKLPRVTKAASYVPPQPSLTAALKNADLVVDGTITKVAFAPSQTVATVQISGTQKVSPTAISRLGGAQPTQIQVALGYSVEPDSSYTTGKLAVPENEPVLLPGSRTKLFLRAESAGSVPQFSIQSWTGGYAISASGTMVPLPGNPFAGQIQGLPDAQFTSRITTELAAIGP